MNILLDKLSKVNNEVVVDTTNKVKHLPNDLATERQKKFAYRIMKTMIEKKIAFPAEITGYYIYNLMTFKEAYVFIQRYKYVCN